MKKKLTAVVIGAGLRGQAYSQLMHAMSDRFQVVAVAEPKRSRREAIQNLFKLPEECCFPHWEPLLAQGKIADIAVICTMDQDHLLPASAAIDLGYDILLEKPVAPNPEDCEKLARQAEAAGVRVIVCHVLRYTPFFTAIKQLITDGVLGDIVSINAEECVGNVHQSHSFVRGNWGNSNRASCMLLQKSCHDLDILQWLVDKPCLKVQSFGSLSHFTEKNAPADAPERCIDGCPHGESCPYNAVKLYLEDEKNAWFREACTGQVAPDNAAVEQALRTTQYGKCVYKCDNDVVDHQTVNLLFQGNITVSFTMCAFNRGGRFIHIMGTKGELRGSPSTGLQVYDFTTKQTTQYPVRAREGLTNGHGGGDQGIIEALYPYLTGTYEGFSVSDIRTSVNNHHLVFAAEQSRKTGTVVDIQDYIHALLP